MPHRDQQLADFADMIGVNVEYVPDLDDDGRYLHHRKLILLRDGLHARHHRSVFAHELAHAAYGDTPTRFGPVHAKQERRADEWAALRLIDHRAYRDAETVHEGHAGAIAIELGVMKKIVDAYQRIILRLGETVYMKPRLGAGQYDDRISLHETT